MDDHGSLNTAEEIYKLNYYTVTLGKNDDKLTARALSIFSDSTVSQRERKVRFIYIRNVMCVNFMHESFYLPFHFVEVNMFSPIHSALWLSVIRLRPVY